MPSPLTSSFASAAAGSNGESAGSRRDNPGGSEWSRNRANGATQTFRRTSTNASSTRESAPSGGGGVYIPPHLNASYQSGAPRNGNAGESRYTKDQLLDIYQNQSETGTLEKHLSDIFTGTWHTSNPRNSNPASWNSRGEGKDSTSGPEVCWDYEGGAEPLGLMEMAEGEQQLFSTSVNSPLKLPQANTKENIGGGTIGGRKSSLSGHHLGAAGITSNTAGRPGVRRRETSDSFSANGPLSPTGSRQFFRDEPTANTPPPALLRRRTDFKDDLPSSQDESKEQEESFRESAVDSETPFASLKRSTTGPLSAGLNGPSSPWSAGPQSSAFGPMGTFGSFAVGSSPLMQDPAEKRPGFGSVRGGSRFKDLLAKTSTEDISPSVKQKMSLGNLENLPEDETESRMAHSTEFFQRRDRSETNPYEDAPLPRSGSAALGGSQELNSATQGIEQLGFSSFGLPANIGTRDFMQREIGPNSAYHQTPQGRYTSHEPMSPTNTNPYQSPPGNRGDDDDVDTNDSESQHQMPSAFASIRRNLLSGSDDRGQTSGPSNNRGLAGLSGLGGLPSLGAGSAWSAGGMSSGTPVRDRNAVSSAFGDPIFSPMSDLQSPGHGGLGGSSFFGSTAINPGASIGRSSKLGALFPPAMQEQMRGESSRNEGPTQEAFPSASRDPFDGSTRRRDEYRGSLLEDNMQSRPSEDNAAPFSPQVPFSQSMITGASYVPITAPGPGQRMSATSDNAGHGLSQSSGSSSSNQIPAAQQRQMVMPDRMRWIYRDPQGNTQGPWSGLEMHDWFKAGFFTAELQVKKLEDVDYEPLAQLVRRIGNSREPFLVPQIGVPHGPATTNPQGNHWASPTVPGAAPAPTSNNNPQPPFASSFPSFGTTLTAEQQNALERRKQEEQFLMARQKEHLAQQQVMMKQMQLQNGPHAMHSLQHHSSAHSLHSQPSFSSITSPSAYQPSPLQGPIQPPQPNFLDSVLRQPPTSNMGHAAPGGELRGSRDDELHSLVDRMGFNQRGSFPPSLQHQENVSAMLQDRSRLHSEQQQNEMRAHRDAFLGQGGQNDRLSEFQNLRGPPDYSPGQDFDDEHSARAIGALPQRGLDDQSSRQGQFAAPGPIGHPGLSSKQNVSGSADDELSLTQQVQRAAATQQQDPASSTNSPWHKFDSAQSAPAPPPVSVSPLPAPAAQRNRQHVADALAAESRSQSQTPIETPSASIAPWAEKSVEVTRGPSLKEIQEVEARKAAEQEEIAANIRRAQADQERLVQPAPPAPGLPASSTWGNLVSPATPTGLNTSVWAKGTTGKAAAPATNGSTKKTLAQIQKEEESRKQRAAAAVSAQVTSALPSAAGGKRYAELASKIATANPAAPTGAWTTVGQGGKTKAPATVIATPQAAARTVSGTPLATKARPALQTSRSIVSTNQNKAADEFTKWAKSALGKGLNNTINVDQFVQSLLEFPPEVEIISESVYANSETLDGRRFAEEFVRRRKLADKGIVDPANSTTPQSASTDSKSGGGWSEVAKKGPAPKEESNAAFKVVSKKKGKR